MRPLADMSNEMDIIPTPDLESPLQGPSTSGWFLKAVASQGGDLLTRHHRWANESHVKPGSAAVFEHKILHHALQLASQHDRLNVMNLTSFEMLCRRIQLHESAWRRTPRTPRTRVRGSSWACRSGEEEFWCHLSLARLWQASLGKEANILKEKRKARESRVALASRPKGGGRGAGGIPAAAP